MAGISGQGTSFGLPNYVGPLFRVTPTDTPFLSAIGGLTGGKSTTSSLFQWQGYDLRDADEGRQRVEGANAPTAEARVRFNVNNVVEIHQEALEISYTKIAATGQYASTGSTHPGAVGIAGTNPVQNEIDWQTRRHLEQIARDIEASFIRGTFANPSTNGDPRKTRGILEAIASNASAAAVDRGPATATATTDVITLSAHGIANGRQVVFTAKTNGAGIVLGTTYYVVETDTNTFKISLTPGGAAVDITSDGTAITFHVLEPLSEAVVLGLLQTVWENGGIQASEAATLMSNGWQKRQLTKLFITDKNYREETRTIGGVSVSTIITDFGRLNLMLNRHMPVHQIAVVSLDECAPVFLQVPEKGFLFVEPLAKVGAAERFQLYGEVGLEYGNEKAHGKITRLATVPNPA